MSASPGALNDAARFEDASESDEAAREGALAANACERAEGGGDGALAADASSDGEFSEEDDEALLAEALDWDFCEGAFAQSVARLAFRSG